MIDAFKFAAACLFSMCLVFVEAHAADKLETLVSTDGGFARVVFEWPERSEMDVDIVNGVVVISAEKPFSVDVDALRKPLGSYVTLVRQDPDLRKLRFAMRGSVDVDLAVVGRQIAVDLIPTAKKDPVPAFTGVVIAKDGAQPRLPVLPSEAEGRGDVAELIPPEMFPFLNVRVGQHDRFTRVVFDWPRPVDYKIDQEGTEIRIVFAEPAHPRLARLRIDPPRWIKTARYENIDDALNVIVSVENKIGFEHFSDGNKIVVDLKAVSETSPVAQKTSEPQTNPAPKEQTEQAGEEKQAKADDSGAMAASHNSKDDKTKHDETKSHNEKAPDGAHESRAGKEAQDGQQEHATATKEEGTSDQEFLGEDARATLADRAGVERSQPSQSDDGHQERQASLHLLDHEVVLNEHQDLEPSEQDDASANPRETDAKRGLKSVPNPLKVDAAVRGKHGVLTFDWKRSVPAAIYHRGGYLWAVFGKTTKLDLNEIVRNVPRYVVEARQLPSEQATVARFKLLGEPKLSAGYDERGWHIILRNDEVEAPPEIDVERISDLIHPSVVRLKLDDPPFVEWITDPEVGDLVAVVPVWGPVRGVNSVRRFVEFTLTKTLHGVVVVPNTDNVTVATEKSDVIIGDNDGLTLAFDTGAGQEGSVSMAGLVKRPGFIDFPGWRRDDLGIYTDARKALQKNVATLKGREYERALLDLAQFYLSHSLGAEALGVLRIIRHVSPSSENTPAFRMMRGVANLMMAREKEAIEDIEHHSLDRTQDALPWRVLSAASQKKWERAVEGVKKSADVISSYPTYWQNRFYLEGANAALALGRVEEAQDLLSRVKPGNEDKSASDLSMLTEARILGRTGHFEEAIETFDKVAASDHLPTSVRARFEQASLLRSHDAASVPEAIDMLDQLRFQWRGDALELNILLELAKAYFENGQYRKGLETLRSAISNFADHDLSRTAARKMGEVFVSLFLEGGADQLPSVTALGLYYDFRELTPIGSQGDAMIRKLADRLVKVDLLDQAADLLSHQVNKRLRGIPKAQVANKLAYVYLLNRQPEEALAIIRKTRQGRLPKQITEQRRLLEAKALAELGLYEHAKETLSGDRRPEARRIMADVHWKSGNWQEAGSDYEDLLANRWEDAKPLQEQESLDVMRSVLSYALSGNQFALERMRERYAEKMLEAGMSGSFNLVTQKVHSDSAEIGQLAKQIASVDTLDAFLSEFRSSLTETEDTLVN